MTVMDEQIVTVGLGEVRTAAGSNGVLLALGLGSCVAVALYDPKARVGGMAHVVLPAPPDGGDTHALTFATGAIPRLFSDVIAHGGDRARLVCKIAGGARVLATEPGRDLFRIGERNFAAVLTELSALGIRPHASDCGGATGRTFWLSVHDGRTAVKRLGEEWKDL